MDFFQTFQGTHTFFTLRYDSNNAKSEQLETC